MVARGLGERVRDTESSATLKKDSLNQDLLWSLGSTIHLTV